MKNQKSLLNSQLSVLKSHKAFTLVELIVVIVILAILATIAFLSFSNQSSSARDSTRLADTSNISKGLGVFKAIAGNYPMPDNYVTINAGTGYAFTQGQAGKKLLGIIKMSETKDVLDGNYYSYSIDNSKSHYSVGGYLENPPTAFLENINPFKFLASNTVNISNAIDYSKRYFFFKGDPVGILTESGTVGNNVNAPIEQNLSAGSTIDILTTDKNLILNTSTTNAIVGSGEIIGVVQSSQNGSYNFNPPSTCPSGFISVPGDEDFNQAGFCVAKYEMKWNGVGTISSTSTATDSYCGDVDNYSGAVSQCLDGNPGIISKADGIPLSRINQTDAIELCKNMGAGYHLITNNEWMTLARNIELVSANWSTSVVGGGYIYNGHMLSLPNYLLAASTNDSDSLYGITGGTGNTAANNNKRTLILSNGQVIWDLAGNIAEYVNKANTLDGSNYNGLSIEVARICSGSTLTWHSFSNGETILPVAPGGVCNFLNGYSYSSIGPITPSLNADNGIGRIVASDTPNNVLRRGGYWASNSHAGIYTYVSDWNNLNSMRTAGFRCAK